MRIALEVSTRATCARRSVGAVAVLDRRILTTGYNGAPRGLDHCVDQYSEWPKGCLMHGHCARSVHAEQNAILQAAMNGVSTRGATMYVTCQPCNSCAKMLINAGIARIVFDGDYPDPFAMELFKDAQLEVIRLSPGSAPEKLL